MCDMMSLLGAGLGMMQSMAQFSADNARYEQQMKQYEQNAINASKAAQDQYSNINIRAQQEDAAANQAKQEASIEAAQISASTEVAASEGGVSGLSVDHILRDIYAQEGRNEVTLDSNQRMSRDYLAGEKKAAEAGGQSQINSVTIPEKPSFLPYALNAFSSALGSFK